MHSTFLLPCRVLYFLSLVLCVEQQQTNARRAVVCVKEEHAPLSQYGQS